MLCFACGLQAAACAEDEPKQGERSEACPPEGGAPRGQALPTGRGGAREPPGQSAMNQIFIPIERVLLETVFERDQRTEYALLEPQGEVSPLRIRFDDLRRELRGRFSDELDAETIVDRIERMEDEQLLVTVTLEHGATERRWSVSIRTRYPYELARHPAVLSELRRSPRRKPEQPKDVRLELGNRSLEGTVYNVSEHGLGIAVLTTQLERLGPFRVDEAVELVGSHQRVTGRIRSQYPASGGCVLGIELRERLSPPGVPDIEA